MVLRRLAPGVTPKMRSIACRSSSLAQKALSRPHAKRVVSVRIVHRRPRRPGLGPVHRRLPNGRVPAAARRMRQCRQPAAGAEHRTVARAGSASGARCESRAPDVAAPARSADSRRTGQHARDCRWSGPASRPHVLRCPTPSSGSCRASTYMKLQPATFLATALMAVVRDRLAAMIPALRAARGSVSEIAAAGHARQRRRESPTGPRGARHGADRVDARPARHGGPDAVGALSRQRRADRVRCHVGVLTGNVSAPRRALRAIR